MQFLKTHWISLACGLVSLVAIVVGVLGMMSDSVVREMNKLKQSAAEIDALRRDAQNQDTINAEKERGQKFQQEYEAVVSMAESINERAPLLEGAFPRPGQREVQYRFKEAYTRKMAELPAVMDAGDLPSAQELWDEAEIMAEIARRKAAEEEAEQPTQPPAGGPAAGAQPRGGRLAPPVGGPPPAGRGLQPATPPAGRGTAPPMGRGVQPAEEAGAGVAQPTQGLPAGVAQEELRQRATLKKARSIRVYASPWTSFHLSPIIQGVEAPSPRDMWYAQVGLWIQEDLVQAIAKTNAEAAQQLDPAQVNVTNLPVKRLQAVRVTGYVTASGAVVPFPHTTATGTADTGLPLSGTASGVSFTGRRSNAQFDVVRFTVVVVIDQRELLKLIDAVTRQNFYQLVGLEFRAVDAREAAEYIYGEAPVVRAVLDFEGYMARRLFGKLMPDEVMQELGGSQTPAAAQPKAAAPQGRGGRTQSQDD